MKHEGLMANLPIISPIVGKPNLNGHIYTKDALISAIEEVKRELKERHVFVLGDIPKDRTAIDYSKVAGEIIDIWMNEDDLTAHIKFRILGTPMGECVGTILSSSCHELGVVPTCSIVENYDEGIVHPPVKWPSFTIGTEAKYVSKDEENDASGCIIEGEDD